MHAIFRWYPDPSLADVLAQHADGVRATLAGVDGVRAYYLVRTDQGTVAVTVCDDEETALRSSSVAAAWLRDNLPDLEVAPPNASAGEVVVSL